MRKIVFSAFLLVGTSAALWAVENFPPPEFTQGYRLPGTTTPLPREAWLGYLDLAVLALTLAAAAYIVLRARSRQHLVVLTLFSLGYFGFYRRGCVCAVGSLQNVALALGHSGYVLPLVIGGFFLLPLLFALFFGRVFCAAVCPLGAAQELVLVRPVRVPGWLETALGTVPYLYLGFAVLFAATDSAFIVCEYDPFVSFFRLGGSTLMLSLGVGMLLLATVIGRPYCRFLCPYGVLLRWLAPLARWRPRISPAECVNCHLCAESCPYGAIRLPTPAVEVGDRRAGKGRLSLLLALLPVLVLGGAGLTRLASPVLAHMHRTVQLADQVWLEEQGATTTKTLASEAFTSQGLQSSDLYQAAAVVHRQYNVGTWFLGAWIGLVFGIRMIALSTRRRRQEYDADPAACVGCGRCYAACPIHHAGDGAALLAAAAHGAGGEAGR